MRKASRRSACRLLLSLSLIAMLALALAHRSSAQVVGATLSGTVKDASGAAIAGAKVSVKNVATGVVRELEADAAGFYTVPNLQPGGYEVSFSAQGFGTQTANITLTVGAQQVANATLTVGQVNQKVVVNVEAPIVELASSAISGNVSATTVRELPLNGRSWTDLAALSAGVDTIHTQVDFSAGSDRGNRGFGQQLTISGARPQQNNYRLDGVSLNDYANGAPGSVLGGNLGVDAIREFSVLTSNYSAEYGKTSGGVVNATTRSGGNQFHGGAYEFLRNDKLDAANFFEAGQRSPFKRNQFGGDVGGPIIKDKTFFFVDYEGIRQAEGIATVDSVPSPAARLGNLSTGTVTPTAAALAYLALYPVPACGAGQDVCQFRFSGQQIVNEDFVTGRVDHKFSDKDSIFGSFMYDRTPYQAPDGFDNTEIGHLTSRQFVSAEETHTFSSTFVNAARFGFNRSFVNDNQYVSALNPAAKDSSLGSFPGRDAAFVNIGGGVTSMPGGIGGLPTYLYRWDSFQAYDDGFVTRGTHSIKFGVGVERMLDQVTADTDPNGVWFFTDLSSFLLSTPSKFQGGIHSAVSPRNLRQTLLGFYVQDDWRVRPSLTLNLGLRYEMTTIPTETSGKFADLRTLDASAPVCGVNVTGCAGVGSVLTKNPTLRNFEPRVGFAWDALHNGRLAIRGGAGMFDVLPLPYQFNLMETQAAPFFPYVNIRPTTPGLPFPLTFPLVNPGDYTGAGAPLVLRNSYFDANPKRDYVMQWNLGVQYQLTSNLAAMVAYVGSRGVHLPYRVDDYNLTPPTLTSAGYLYPQVDVNGNLLSGPMVGQAPSLINNTFSSIHGMFYDSRSYYNALQAQLSKRMSHGVQVVSVFTWAKSMDTNSATVAGDTFANSISSLNWFDLRLTRALSDFNVGRNFTISGTWDVPSPKSWSGAKKWAVDGWELGTILTLSDGVPFTPTWGTGNDPSGTLSSDDYAYPNRLGGSGCKSLVNPGNPNNYIKTECFSVPTAPSPTFWSNNCSPAPPSLGYGFNPASPGTPDPANNGNPPPGWLPAYACFNLRGNSGRNILIGPGLANLDFSVYKNNYVHRISEDFNVQFRAEFFNILNHANFGVPTPGDTNTDIFDATGLLNPIAGSLVRTTTSQREIQFALKFLW